MEQGPKRTRLTGVAALVLFIFVCTGGVAGGVQSELAVQPKALNHTGIYAVRDLDPSLTGAAVKLGLVCRSISYSGDEPQGDYRPNVLHECLRGKTFGFHDQGTWNGGISPHSTAICSILFGRDANGFSAGLGAFRYEGIVPEAEGDVYEFQHFVLDYVSAGLAPDVDIMSMSIGSQFEYWWTRGIESLAEHYGLFVVAGIGNGLNAHDPPLYPGASSNVIGVGVIDSVNTGDIKTALSSFALAYPEHSTFGPTVDGRCKPDIVAPGNVPAADANDANGYEATGNWSSFSTPIVSGTAGLLVQKARQDPNLRAAVSAAGGNCVIKAILMNSATKLAYWHKGRLGADDDHEAPLDHIQGAGMLNAVGAYNQLVGGQHKPGDVSSTGWDNNHVDKGDNLERVYKIKAPEAGGKVITATAVWNRHYDSFHPFESRSERDSNLRLELWAIDVNNPENDCLLDYSDSRVDNVEHMYALGDANYTDYEIVVAYSDSDISEQAGQKEERYGLAWNVSVKADNDNDILLYDLNADGAVDDSDSITFVSNWLMNLTSPGSYALGDVNRDGVVESKDLQIIEDHKGLEADWRSE
ncbi:MAG: S8 family serine peptidase [Planctomycetota bacterium]|jgi:hypothetical protein